jgi:hydroxymethylbilane synthase
VVVGARGSALSRAQSQRIIDRLAARFPERRFTLEVVATAGDRAPETPLAALGEGEGVFVKELEAALLDGRIDLAVHSLKDLPLAVPAGLELAAVTARDDVRDALVSRTGAGLAMLPAGARIGTSSLRRRSQLLRARSDLAMVDFRGNVDTRLRKLEQGQVDAIVIAACGLIRLGLEARITEFLDLDVMLPEPGQGALAVQARAGDEATLELVRPLNDASARACVEAERGFLGALGGGCRVPIAAYADLSARQLSLVGAVIAANGSRQLRGQQEGAAADPAAVGRALADRLIADGALDLLK